jgi:dienelactone hydrolase
MGRASMSYGSKPDMGVYDELFHSLPPKNPPLSFLSNEWPSVEAWRKQARAALLEQMSFHPKTVPLNSSVDSKESSDGVVVEQVSYDMPYGPRTKGRFLYPEGGRALPAVLALHDHGGFYYYGNEKVVQTSISSKLLQDFKDRSYGGRSWATELAKRGFAVLAVDSFMWGSRKIPLDSINPAFAPHVRELQEGSDQFIAAYNHYWDSTEARVTMSTVLNAGTTWPGILYYEDQRSIDYLLTRPEADASRIGCGGLSGGGLRSVFLTGLEPRIKAGFTVGWMCALQPMLSNHVQGHDVVMYVPHLLEMLDIPDVMSLHGPSPMMALYDNEDGLFPYAGQVEAHQKLTNIFAKMGQPEKYVGKFYPGRHKFDVQMQEDAFDWLEREL